MKEKLFFVGAERRVSARTSTERWKISSAAALCCIQLAAKQIGEISFSPSSEKTCSTFAAELRCASNLRDTKVAQSFYPARKPQVLKRVPEQCNEWCINHISLFIFLRNYIATLEAEQLNTLYLHIAL